MSNRKKIILGVVCVVILTAAIFGGKYLISLQKYKKVTSEMKIGSVDLSKVADGKYLGSCDVVYVGATVSVTVKDSKIIDIVLVKHKTDKGKPGEAVTAEVIKEQSLQVDMITGATNSSKVILKSIENALNSRKL
ncbi:FMN-binding protein [Clostridium lacusfryxellense]|uniref:FMN-binding protein n=1 Tax=Clostridium lacusfryxellense TaxID=205328 RepID=UPI001C0DB3B4|nr:FMN-binding protein [Clostridium lacusfryxellense]MBU3112552.1 FMN-binding protein [Clostridium lacusfryxellense]